MKKLLLAISCIAFLSWGSTAFAIPSLGVAPTENGTYNGSLIAGDNDYITQFTTKYLGGTEDIYFVLPNSGESLTVWFGSDDGLTDFEKDSIHIYLATNSAAGDDFWFNGIQFDKLADVNGNLGDTAASFKPLPYYGVDIGFVSSAGWLAAPSGPFTSGANMEFYFNTGIIEYSGFLEGEWMFAFADYSNPANGIFDNGTDDFSPKTTAAAGVPVPEPATILLFGAGLVGLAGIGRKKRKK